MVGEGSSGMACILLHANGGKHRFLSDGLPISRLSWPHEIYGDYSEARGNALKKAFGPRALLRAFPISHLLVRCMQSGKTTRTALHTTSDSPASKMP